MKALRRALFVLGLAWSAFANATSFSTDQSDLWFIASESGWGMQLVQRGQVIFATLFVYGPNGSPTWYVATMSPTAVPYQWSGDLFATTGPWFGTVPFNPNSVVATKVGTMTWNGTFVETGTVTYSVNGVQVTKNVTREPLVADDYNGIYLGAIKYTAAGCSNPAMDGSQTAHVTISIVQTGPTVSVTTTDFTGTAIVLTGTLTQFGQFGVFTGFLSPVSFTVFEINGQLNYWTARFDFGTSPVTGCTVTGYLGGIRQ